MITAWIALVWITASPGVGILTGRVIAASKTTAVRASGQVPGSGEMHGQRFSKSTQK